MPIQTVPNWKKYLTEDEQKDIRRGKIADFIFGGDREDRRLAMYQPIATRRVGTEAIQNVESGLADTSGIGDRSFSDLSKEHIYSKGLGDLPSVKSYVGDMEKRATKENLLSGAEEVKGMIGEDYPVETEYLFRIAKEGNLQGFHEAMKKMMGNLEAKRVSGRVKDIEEYKAGAREKLEGTKHGYNVKLEGEKQANRKKIEFLRQAGNKALEELRQKGDSDELSATDQRFNDVENAFTQLKAEHDKIWTGPIAAWPGRANVFSKERAAFKATRAYLLKTIGRAFENRLSNMDMKFYERMIPNDIHTKDQFDSVKTSIENLVKWRLKKWKEDGKDPGLKPVVDETGVTGDENPEDFIDSWEEDNQ